jgi:hypothetical protein
MVLRRTCSTARPAQWTLLAIASLLIAGDLIAVAGCGPASDRLPISGRITLDGVPLDSGSIHFTSKDSERLSASGATIRHGEFNIPQEQGLPPGTYFVEISSPDPSAPLVAYEIGPGQPRLPPTAPERIPPEYNANRTIEVTADGDNDFTFDIERRRAK